MIRSAAFVSTLALAGATALGSSAELTVHRFERTFAVSPVSGLFINIANFCNDTIQLQNQTSGDFQVYPPTSLAPQPPMNNDTWYTGSLVNEYKPGFIKATILYSDPIYLQVDFQQEPIPNGVQWFTAVSCYSSIPVQYSSAQIGDKGVLSVSFGQNGVCSF